ncbi:MAG TPA: hypothetical protein VJU86_15575 [Pyrinomonadaceae bacterium]|nr:hypothetical protein [Pyrinomonadaceae bacterium]
MSASSRPRPVLAVFLHLGIITGVIWLDWMLFSVLFKQNFFVWFLKNGSVISLATGFLGLVWKDLKVRLGLIASHPSAYYAACLQLVGVFIISIGSTGNGKPKELPFDIGLNNKPGQILDGVFYILLSLLMAVMCMAWLVVAAPLNYFVTLIAGAPARQELRGKLVSTSFYEETVSSPHRGGAGTLHVIDPSVDRELESASTAISFARDPFAVTQATSAVMLWIANLIYGQIQGT